MPFGPTMPYEMGHSAMHEKVARLILGKNSAAANFAIGRRWSWLHTRRLLGGLLLVSAGLKAAGIIGAKWDPTGIFRSPGLILFAIEVEFSLSFWLLSGVAARLCWASTIACFFVLAGVSAHLWRAAEPECGCLGPVRAPPLAMLVVDIIAIALLVVFRPPSAVAIRGLANGNHRWLLCVGILGSIPVVGLTATSYAVLGQPLGLIGYLRGARVWPSPRHPHLSECVPGALQEVRIDLVNRGENEVAILGAASSYPSLSLVGVPLAIPASHRQSVTLRFQAPRGIGTVLFCNCPIYGHRGPARDFGGNHGFGASGVRRATR